MHLISKFIFDQFRLLNMGEYHHCTDQYKMFVQNFKCCLLNYVAFSLLTLVKSQSNICVLICWFFYYYIHGVFLFFHSIVGKLCHMRVLIVFIESPCKLSKSLLVISSKCHVVLGGGTFSFKRVWLGVHYHVEWLNSNKHGLKAVKTCWGFHLGLSLVLLLTCSYLTSDQVWC